MGMNGKNKKSISYMIFQNRLLTIIFLLPFVEPIYCNMVPWMDRLFRICYLLAILFAGAILLEHKFKLSKAMITLLSFDVIIAISTILGGHSPQVAFNYFGKSLILAIGIEYAIRGGYYSVLDILQDILEIIIIINFATIILYPNGLYINSTDYITNSENWFMGFKNVHIRTMLPAIAISFANSIRKYGKITVRSWAIFAVIVTSVFMVNSSTAIVGIVIFSVLALCFKYNVWSKLLNIKNSLIGIIILFLLIYFFDIQRIFSFLLEDVLGKDLTFHNRLVIWQKSIAIIINKPMLGIGCQTTDEWYSLLGAPHAHNYYLYNLLLGGIVGIVLLIYFYIHVSKKIYLYRNIKSTKFFQAVIISFLIMGLTESLTASNLIFPIMVLAYHIDLLDYDQNLASPRKKIKLKWGAR